MAEDMERAVAMVRRGYEAFNDGDFDAAVEMMHPEIEWQRVAEVEQPLRGREAVREFFQPEVFKRQHSEIFEVTPVGEHVLVHARFHGSFAGSGIELTQDGF